VLATRPFLSGPKNRELGFVHTGKSVFACAVLRRSLPTRPCRISAVLRGFPVAFQAFIFAKKCIPTCMRCTARESARSSCLGAVHIFCAICVPVCARCTARECAEVLPACGFLFRAKMHPCLRAVHCAGVHGAMALVR
jgi:hypothetical protein